MARPAPTTISCPACGQPFNAILEQILDVGLDPSAKERLLSGRINLITCPHCGYRGMVGTPLMYHDPKEQLAIAYVPLELNLQQQEREKLIGDMTNAVMRALPEDAPKGYLLQPKTALTLQGMVEQVLEADGITPEMIQNERRKIEIIDEFATATAEEREQLLADNQDLFDITFLELLTAAAQAATQSGDQRRALKLLNLRTHLLETTEAGQELQARQDALTEASQEIQALGEGITREAFVELLVNAVDNPFKVDALATIGRSILDYSTFQLVTEHIDRTDDPEQKQKLTTLRERLLTLAAEFEKQSRAQLERAADTLRTLIQAPDLPQAIRANANRIDELFLQVLQVNLEEARKSGNPEVSGRLREIRDEVLKLIQDAAPPEIRLINQLLGVETDDESLRILREHEADINEDMITVMDDLVEQLRQGGSERVAERLEMLRDEAEKML
jgi:hypothetical protein